ncbi:hypothetical protein L249_5926 [Ophiocordyceps polyrhachis-furcata BCC 54312]|uniref:Uncharacterized protein n=1 Tax=Ophiocordyceps polyrhachis-furcata BCC 54312 TaxID=1330021 RepID=A0A367LJ91_9HYPO|nr:hypothetical protein L249_5926 [Ophiocordyceps polyrhachis-furcata BCC 54312]
MEDGIKNSSRQNLIRPDPPVASAYPGTNPSKYAESPTSLSLLRPHPLFHRRPLKLGISRSSDTALFFNHSHKQMMQD